MKRNVLILLLLMMLSACGTLDRAVVTDVIPTLNYEEIRATADALVYDMLTQTQEAMPTGTVVSPTSTMEPSVNIVKTPKLCPSGNPDVDLSGLETVIELDDGSRMLRDDYDVEQAILNTLNAGGVEKIISYYSEKEYSEWNFRAVDITGDNNFEIFVNVGRAILGFRCIDGIYDEFFRDAAYEYPPSILYFGDLNNNGFTDIAIDKLTCHYCTGVSMYEWRDGEFRDLIRSSREYNGEITYFNLAELHGYTRANVTDLDGDGIFELILQGGIPSYIHGLGGGDGHWREETVVYAWDGVYYTFQSQQYSAPEFRYEAVQDGDAKLSSQDYDAALSLYEQAINDEALASWDEEEWRRLVFFPDDDLGQPDPYLIPYNEKEYQQLLSYARYRMMLVYILQGKLDGAKNIHEELLNYVKDAPAGSSYARLATIFLDEYLVSSNIEKACSFAVAYTEEHPEMLYPLGNTDETWYGLLVRSYYPEDICLPIEELGIKE